MDPDESKWSPLERLCADEEAGIDEFHRVLASTNPGPDDLRRPLEMIMQDFRPDVTAVLLNAGATALAASSALKILTTSYRHLGFYRNDEDHVANTKLLLAHNADPDWDPNSDPPPNFGCGFAELERTAYEDTIYFGLTSTCRLMIEHRGGVRTGPERILSPLVWAIKSNRHPHQEDFDHRSIVRLLMQHGCWDEPITPAVVSALEEHGNPNISRLSQTDTRDGIPLLEVYGVYIKWPHDPECEYLMDIHDPQYAAIDHNLIDDAIDALRQGAIQLCRDKEERYFLLDDSRFYPKKTQAFVQLVCARWSTDTHHIQSKATRVCIRTTLLVSAATHNRGLDHFIPTEMWLLICSFIAD